jgi:hypothetical protein
MYPKLNIRSKTDFKKWITSKRLPSSEAKSLINDCKKQKDDFWHDYDKMSEPENGKYTRSAYKRKPLYRLLGIIDKGLLAPYDMNLPYHIYGGRRKLSSLDAAGSLINHRRKRWLLKLDLKRFFEQVPRERVFSFFYYKCGCKTEFANYVADLCCVPEGPKGSRSSKSVLARGFAPSTRLAVWTNLDFFMQLKRLVSKNFEVKQHDPRVMVFIDDIGITISNTDQKSLEKLRDEIIALARKHKLDVNLEKTKIFKPDSEQEILGVLLHSRSLGFTTEKKEKQKLLKRMARNIKTGASLNKFHGLMNHKKQMQKRNEAIKSMH